MQGIENKTRRQLRRAFNYTHIPRKYYILGKINHSSEDLLVSLLLLVLLLPIYSDLFLFLHLHFYILQYLLCV